LWERLRARTPKSRGKALNSFHDPFDSHAQFCHHFAARRTQTESINTNYFAIQADESVPKDRNPSFDSDSSPARGTQHIILVALVLTQEPLSTGQRNDSNSVAQLFGSVKRVLKLAPGRQNNRVKLAGLFARYIPSLKHALTARIQRHFILDRNRLARQR